MEAPGRFRLVIPSWRGSVAPAPPDLRLRATWCRLQAFSSPGNALGSVCAYATRLGRTYVTCGREAIVCNRIFSAGRCGSMRGARGWPPGSPAGQKSGQLEEHCSERTHLAKAHPIVSGARLGVEPVDVQAGHRREGLGED